MSSFEPTVANDTNTVANDTNTVANDTNTVANDTNTVANDTNTVANDTNTTNVEVANFVVNYNCSERFAKVMVNPLLQNDPVDVELATEYLLAVMDDPKRNSILANRSCTPAIMYFALASSNRFDLVDLLGAHPVHGYNQPDSYEIDAILTNSMFQNSKMLAHITSKIPKVSESTFGDILRSYIDGLDNVFTDGDGDEKLSDYKTEFDVLRKYYYAKYYPTN